MTDKWDIYNGPIEVGMLFLWEPFERHARCLIQVTRVDKPENDEARIFSREVNLPESWNDESRFREAVVRVDDLITALLAAERKKALEEGYKAGFMASGQGWNGEYPMQDKGADPEADDYWMDCRDEAIRALMEKEQGE